MSEWEHATLNDVVSFQRGHDLPTPDRVPGQVPVVGSFGITGWHNEAKAPGPGVTIGRSGASIGKAVYIDCDYWPLNTCLYATDFKGNDLRWVYHLVDTIDFTAYNSGSAQPSLNRNFLKQIPVLRPPCDEQRRIAAVLGSLDDLIETELHMADTVDDLWHTMVAAALSSTEEVALSSLAAFINGRNFTNGASDSGRFVVRTPEVRTGPSDSTPRNDVDADADNIANPGDILFVWSGSLLVGRWRWRPALINQHIFKVLPHEGVPPWLVYWAIEQLLPEFLSLAADKATTMGHIKREHLDTIVTLPSRAQWAQLDRIIGPLWAESLQARRQAIDLTRTRDELLPLLMSGRVRVVETVGTECKDAV